MSTIQKGILGGVSGKIGNVVGGCWKGIQFLRSLPSGNNSNTMQQKQQRLKFATVASFLRTIMVVIRLGFNSYANKMTAYNAAFSYHFHHALEGEYPDYTLNYSKVLVSRGHLSNANEVSCASTEAAKIEVTWNSPVMVGTSSPTDVVVLVLINDAKQEAIYLLDAGTRAEGSAVVEVPSSYTGDEVHCYLALRTATSVLKSSTERNDISTSQYAGSVIVA